jgi:hypothetical protein
VPVCDGRALLDQGFGRALLDQGFVIYGIINCMININIYIEEELAAPKPAKKSKSGSGDQDSLKALASVLPVGAQKLDYDGKTKSYTLLGAGDSSKISVLVDKETFYVYPVNELPIGLEDKFTINKQVYFFTHTHFCFVVGLCLTKGVGLCLTKGVVGLCLTPVALYKGVA